MTWIQLCPRYNNRCARCGELKTLTRDHIIPLSRGGAKGLENQQPLCAECNVAKANQLPTMEELERRYGKSKKEHGNAMSKDATSRILGAIGL